MVTGHRIAWAAAVRHRPIPRKKIKGRRGDSGALFAASPTRSLHPTFQIIYIYSYIYSKARGERLIHY